MATQVIASIQFLRQQAASLLLYQAVLETKVGQAFLDLLQAIHDSNDAEDTRCLKAYGHWFQVLVNSKQNWQDALMTEILQADNLFTRAVQQTTLSQLPVALVKAAQHDLQILQNLYDCGDHQLSRWIQDTAQLSAAPIVWNPALPTVAKGPIIPLQQATSTKFLQQVEDWANAIDDLAVYYRQQGTGLFAKYRALRWRQGHLEGIPHPDPICLQALAGYEYPRTTLLKNTAALLAGYPALHVLLYGSRGSGKSSLVKALLNEYADQGLRLIEVAKQDLKDLSAIADQLRHLPQKFIIFVDDLSFEEDEDTYKALKVVLEGNVTVRPQNVVVYATSNRRHLIREFFGDRPHPADSDEVHAWDTVQEKLSFSDRFGLTLTFEPADQNTYLAIVHHLATEAKITLEPAELESRALQWATRHNGRSGRTARQFIDFLQADLAISGSPEPSAINRGNCSDFGVGK
ncbi:MAG: ATP-binding protein [Cyanothece sp. SIO1E1]|nr:ATP-binding protein [Cyanothece sp. SIO1E1]